LPAVAVRLGRLFGDGDSLWVRMQSRDEWLAGRAEEKRVSN